MVGLLVRYRINTGWGVWLPLAHISVAIEVSASRAGSQEEWSRWRRSDLTFHFLGLGSVLESVFSIAETTLMPAARPTSVVETVSGVEHICIVEFMSVVGPISRAEATLSSCMSEDTF